jgi:hypothetical protein
VWGTPTTDGVAPSTVGYFTTTLSLPAVTDADSVTRVLTELLVATFDNGVDVEGGWDCSTDGQTPDWDAVVAALANDGSAAEDADGA